MIFDCVFRLIHSKKIRKLIWRFEICSKLIKKIAERYHANVILKGNRTIVCSKTLKIYECAEGGPELSTGGTGDVLAGVIAALVAQNVKTLDSCLLAVAVHSRAGKLFKEEIGEIGLNASNLIKRIRNLLNE